MKLSRYFSLEEMTFSQTAARKCIDNTPPKEVLENLTHTAMEMDKVRALLNRPVLVSSGYRSMKLNRAIGGALTSAHMTGFAIDFTCPEYGTPKDIFNAIRKSPIRYDQLIEEGQWVHISFGPGLRNQKLIARFIDGKAHYTEVA